MARGGGLRKGLTLGLAAGVGVAVLRAARARRAPQPAAAPPTWPPLPTATTHQPPAAATPGRSAGGDHGTAALVAEAAVLEAAGVTEAAEVDPAAVQASRSDVDVAAPAVDDEVLTGWAPPPPGEAPRPGESPWAADLLDDLAPPIGDPVATAPPDDDIEAVILAEEAALEAERLEAERLELARLERERLAAEGDDDDPDERSRREQEREEALARFAAQREEAQALLALQEEREANADDAASDADQDQRPAAAGLTAKGADGEGAAAQDLWAQEVTDLEPAVQLVDDGGSSEPTLAPLVPDEAVADLDEEPAWGIAVEPEPAPALVPAAPPAGNDDEAELEAGLDDGADVRPTPVDEGDGQPRRPLMADDLPSSFGESSALEPPTTVDADADVEDVEDDEDDEDYEDDDEEYEEPAVPDGVVVAAVGDAPPADAPSAPASRRPILTSDFDDALPDELLEEGDGEQAAETGRAERRRSGQPRVPLKARRLPADVDAGAAHDVPVEGAPVGTGGPAPQLEAVPAAPADDVPVEPAPVRAAASSVPQEPTPTAPAKATKAPRAAKTAPLPAPAKGASAAKAAKPAKAAKAAPAAKKVAKKVTVPKKAPSKKAATSEAPPPKRISSRRKKPDVRWVEPVGGTCPTGYPVKASLSSGIFHVAGGLFYDRTRPDRCYRDPAEATADGLRQAKR